PARRSAPPRRRARDRPRSGRRCSASRARTRRRSCTSRSEAAGRTRSPWRAGEERGAREEPSDARSRRRLCRVVALVATPSTPCPLPFFCSFLAFHGNRGAMGIEDRSRLRGGGSKVVRPFAFFRAGNQAHASAANRPILVLEEVYKYFRPDVPTLRGVNLSVERGEFVFITGPSGAGKSTLLSLIYRGQTVDEGRILFTGRDVARLTSRSIPFLRRNLGVVFQDFKIIGHWTVFENVAVALEILSMPRRLVRSRVAEALERVGLAGRGDELTSSLSGGEQQRVAIARAIVSEPALLLADEPTGNLDPTLALDILTLFEEIHATGTTVLFATHDHSLLEAQIGRASCRERVSVPGVAGSVEETGLYKEPYRTCI